VVGDVVASVVADTAGMALADDVLNELLVHPGTAANLRGRATTWDRGGDLADLADDELKQLARERLEGFVSELRDAQRLLWASDTNSLLIIFQALDAAGKDGTISHIMSGVNPQGCQVFSFRQPSAEELDHTFLWRASKSLPERGRIGIFNRSYYEDVLVVRVHPEYLEKQQMPPGSPRGDALWQQRFEDINAFEQHLHRNGTRVVKFFLNVSKDEQRRRFLSRVDNEDKYWKFSPTDLSERAHWDEYITAFEDALTATSTEHAPWYVIPADQKHIMRAMAAGVVVRTIQSLDLSYPTVGPEKLEAIEKARAELLAEAPA
jgi:PPK2 family polyphosphate:nucleotide phosphotransferase